MKFIHILPLLVSLLFSGACTHNDGDIGPLFGTWVLDRMEADEIEQDLGSDHTFMQFQGGVVMTKLIDDRHSLLFYSVGSWEREGDVLALNYTHSDDTTEPGEGQYSAPDWLMFTSNGINRLDILSLDDKRMRLKLITPDNVIVLYDFRKTF